QPVNATSSYSPGLFYSQPITNATNTNPIIITTTNTTSLHTGDQVTISGVLGNLAANGTFPITVLTATTFALVGPAGSGFYAGGGTWQTNVSTKYQQPLEGDLWMTLIDGDHIWRQDSQTTRTDQYHFMSSLTGPVTGVTLTGFLGLTGPIVI